MSYRAHECAALARGDSELSALDAAKKQTQELLAEYLVSGDVAEARQGLPDTLLATSSDAIPLKKRGFEMLAGPTSLARHRTPCNSRNEGAKCVSMTVRAVSGGP